MLGVDSSSAKVQKYRDFVVTHSARQGCDSPGMQAQGVVQFFQAISGVYRGRAELGVLGYTGGWSWLFVRLMFRASPLVTVSEAFVALALRICQTRRTLLSSPPRSSQQPIRDADDLGGLVPVPSLFRVLNGVTDDAPLLVELEQEQTSELFVGAPLPSDNAGDLLHHIADRAAVFLLRLAARLPLDNQLLAVYIRWRGCVAVLDHALRQNLQLHIPQYWYPTPCDWRRPERCCVCNLAAHGGEMRVCRGEEVKADLRRQNVLR
jgi:hypothetical protein